MSFNTAATAKIALFSGRGAKLVKQPTVKEFPGENKDPTTYVLTEGNIIGVTTPQHMQAHQLPLEAFLKKVIEEARAHGDSIFPKYGEGGDIGGFHADPQTSSSSSTNTAKS